MSSPKKTPSVAQSKTEESKTVASQTSLVSATSKTEGKTEELERKTSPAPKNVASKESKTTNMDRSKMDNLEPKSSKVQVRVGSKESKTSNVAKSGASKIEHKMSDNENKVVSKDSGTQVVTLPSEERHTNSSEELKYGATHVIQLFVPVTICILFVIISVNCLPIYSGTNVQIQGGGLAPFSEDQQSIGSKFGYSLLNALIIIGFIILVTSILIALYYYEWYCVIYGWLLITSFMILFLFSTIYFQQVFKALKYYVDLITAFILVWNIGWTGILSIWWKAPLRLQQANLIFISAMISLQLLILLPPWTGWILLALLVIWDLVAVLAPFGPLKILVETAKERNEPIMPGMIYSSMAHMEVLGATDDSQATSKEQSKTENKSVSQKRIKTGKKALNSPKSKGKMKSVHEVEAVQLTSSTTIGSGGVKLGLGDFIFYSVLIGKVTLLNDWNTTLACFVAILIGLCLTLMLLAIYKKALPALPISITFALIFYFCTSIFVQPFADHLANEQIFI